MLTQESGSVRRMHYHAVVQDLSAAVRPVEFREYGKEPDPAPQINPDTERVKELELQLAEREKAHGAELERVRQQAFEEGKKKREGENLADVATARTALERALSAFVSTRDSYLKDVEREVVRLALALAERILHREAQMDPLLLSGAVRVALGQLGETTDVRLRVPAAEISLWTDMLRLMPRLPLRPELVSDERMQAGECVIESHLGTVDLGVRAQLAEVERGFFDLLSHRDASLPMTERA
ncbi:FliH/SctL family protein [Silvibacterium acidisoli]|uniref:FliH/SctL family protein n=1 Tax=Acidobacteriaceae bacterium ZG23-2 TaxID=2883246 RepID=UPI00406D0BB2